MFKNPNPSRFVCPSATRVLLCIIACAQQGGPITLRRVTRELGFRSPNAVYGPMKVLKKHGLLDWEKVEGYSNKQSATIRPLVYLKLTREGRERFGAPGGAP